jgi:malate dehydrogenase (oxaloacetate-decarboxylating)(NADP+)
MVKQMADKPLVLALAKPTPEIMPDEARAARPDVMICTGRSDYPNQVNNVLCFPYIFRGALDVRATAITEEMKLAAARAIAALAREDVPESVSRAYGGERFRYGREYIIPKPLDQRVLLWVAPAVARAAMDAGVARTRLDVSEYVEALRSRQSRAHQVLWSVVSRARKKLTRIAFTEGHHPSVQQAAAILREDRICEPVLLGPVEPIRQALAGVEELKGVQIVDALQSPDVERYVQRLWALRQRHGVTLDDARRRLRTREYFAAVMLELGEVDGLVTGVSTSYAEAIRPSLEVIRTIAGRRAAGVQIVVTKSDFKFFADCTLAIDPSAAEVAEIAIQTAELARYFEVRPRIALLSYSTYGSAAGQAPAKMREAAQLVRQRRPDLEVDGEVQASMALNPDVRRAEFPFSLLREDANVFVFPGLDAANISYQLLERLGGAENIGPVLLGMKRPVNILPTGCSVQQIVNLASLTALRAQGEEFVF